ncbi:MAG: DNA polymerase III subunit beta, partial [Candidatus Angelobacter sp.]
MPSAVATEVGTTMEINVSKSDLLKELTATQGVVERKTTIPILSNFLFEASGERLAITATDLDLSLRTSCQAKVKKEGSCTVPARKLYDYVKLLGDGDISMKLLENHWVQIRSGRSSTKMVGMARANFPALPPFPNESSIQLPAQVLRNLIAKTIFAISNEESRYTLNGALLVLKPESIIMVATDGHRLAHIEHTNSKLAVSGELKVLVPKKAMSELSTLLNSTDAQTVEFARDESTLFFRIGGRLLTSRQLTGQFPNYEAVLPRDNNKAVAVHCDELSAAIQRVAQFADERSNAIRMRVEQSELKISSSNTETGEAEDSLETAYTGDPM